MQNVASAGLIATSSRTAPPVAVHRPTTCEAALAALATLDHPVLVAGGTDLCAQYNEGLQPGALVALDRIAALRTVAVDRDAVRIGSGVTHDDGAGDPVILRHLPGFARAWRQIANVRVRFWATIGGNLMARRPRYEMSVLLSALEARLHFLDADGASLVLSPADVWAGRAPPRGLLHHIAIPLRGRQRFVYDRGLRPATTLALRLDDGGGTAAIATEYRRPQVLPLATAGAPAERAEAAFASLPDDFADAVSSNWYLRRAGTVMLRRALERDGTDVRA